VQANNCSTCVEQLELLLLIPRSCDVITQLLTKSKLQRVVALTATTNKPPPGLPVCKNTDDKVKGKSSKSFDNTQNSKNKAIDKHQHADFNF
jgi:hypothetical protein